MFAKLKPTQLVSDLIAAYSISVLVCKVSTLFTKSLTLSQADDR